jgi:hypothetical protein
MLAGLRLPFVTDADPDVSAEGSIDPLGMGRIADRLADAVAPEVTARMFRIRFITAISVCSSLLEEPADLISEGGTPAYLAFEWIVVEAFARRLPASGTGGVPGIRKARSRVSDRRRHLDGASYLEVPKVFGFHGVYKRLARDLELVDDDFTPLPRADVLVTTWERQQNLDGFACQRRGTPGGRLAAALKAEVQRALDQEGVRLSPTSRWWQDISATLAPGDAKAMERRRLWEWLTDERHPVRTELATLLAKDRARPGTERSITEHLLTTTLSTDLRARLRAISAYEAAMRPLDDIFGLLRSIASQRTPSMVRIADAARNPRMATPVRALPLAMRAAGDGLEELGLGAELESAFGQFVDSRSTQQMIEAVLDRHDVVQADKQKRSWFERDATGFAVRGVGRLDEPFEEGVEYIHPYRLRTLRSFASDLRPVVRR